MDERQQHWEQVYRNKMSSEVSWYQQQPALSLQLIEKVVLERDVAIIDVGGGASTLVDALLGRGYQRLSVLDISATALLRAQQRLGEASTQVEWLEADATAFTPTRSYSLWHDRAVFHFLTAAADREKYLQVLRTALQPGAYLVIATFATDGPAMCSGLPVEQYDAPKMEETLGQAFQLLELCDEQHLTPGGVAQHFNYFLFRYQPQ